MRLIKSTLLMLCVICVIWMQCYIEESQAANCESSGSPVQTQCGINQTTFPINCYNDSSCTQYQCSVQSVGSCPDYPNKWYCDVELGTAQERGACESQINPKGKEKVEEEKQR